MWVVGTFYNTVPILGKVNFKNMVFIEMQRNADNCILRKAGTFHNI